MLLQFFVVILTVVLGQVLPSCYVDLPDKGVTYDLNAFEGLAVEVSDNRGEGNDPWYYKVYVCSNSPPNDLPDPSCKNTTNDDGTPDPLSGKPGPAFQYGPGQGFCKRLGNDVSTATIAPLFSGSSNRDNRGYARGVLLNYTGGNMCWSNTQNAFVPRQVTLIMECHDGPIVPPGSTLVLESTSCQYFVSIKSRMGCPVQCLGAGGTVCGTNGVCGYDATNGYARCYCNEGFGGGDCTILNFALSEPLKDYGPAIGGGFIGGVLFGGLCVLLYGLYSAKVEGRPLFFNGLDPATLPLLTSGVCCPSRGSLPGKPYQFTSSVPEGGGATVTKSDDGEGQGYTAPL